MENLPHYLKTSGLVFNVIGMFILFFTGLPARHIPGEHHASPEEINVLNKLRYWSRIALVLFILGLVLQIAGAMVKQYYLTHPIN